MTRVSTESLEIIEMMRGRCPSKRLTLSSGYHRNEDTRPKHDAACERHERSRARVSNDSQQRKTNQLRSYPSGQHSNQFNRIVGKSRTLRERERERTSRIERCDRRAIGHVNWIVDHCLALRERKRRSIHSQTRGSRYLLETRWIEMVVGARHLNL